jgi:hypothetical protein
MADYIDKFDTVPEGQNWLWWHFKRGGCFVLANIATAIIVALIIYLVVLLLGSSISGIADFVGKSGVGLVLVGAIIIILGAFITANSVGGEIYNRLWRPCEQAPK